MLSTVCPLGSHGVYREDERRPILAVLGVDSLEHSTAGATFGALKGYRFRTELLGRAPSVRRTADTYELRFDDGRFGTRRWMVVRFERSMAADVD